ncbi:MAG: TIGR04283 family arsenosugar biosynthesis glycosyltransferase, partial [Gammaproteobacteria bacterium]
DATVAAAEPLADRVLQSLSGRSRQMNRGAAAASGDWLLFLHVDSRLPARVDRLIAAATDGGKVQRLWFDVRFDHPGLVYRVIAWFMNRRARLTGVSTGDQAQVVARQLFQTVGGFPDMPLMEDVALSKRMRGVADAGVIAEPVIASPRRWQERGVVVTVLAMWWLRLKYFCGADPAALARQYYPGHAGRLLAQDSLHYPNGRLAVFAREPVLGQVKTRLAAALGEQSTLVLYRAMLRHIVAVARDWAIAPVSLWVAGNPQQDYLESLCAPAAIHPQGVGDLGQRMDHAITRLLAQDGVDYAVIVGSDCPVVDGLYLLEAFDALARGNELVLGPAEDGGYVLIGLRTPRPELFSDIDWGSAQVLSQTLARANAAGVRYQLLRTVWDVDHSEDLARLQQLSPHWQQLLHRSKS